MADLTPVRSGPLTSQEKYLLTVELKRAGFAATWTRDRGRNMLRVNGEGALREAYAAACIVLNVCPTAILEDRGSGLDPAYNRWQLIVWADPPLDEYMRAEEKGLAMFGVGDA